MIKTQKKLIIALLFPIVALLTLTTYKKYALETGKEITLKITGYDPRDLLSGHYLTYNVEYGIEKMCSHDRPEDIAWVCLEPSKYFTYEHPTDCKTFIVGECDGGQFKAGIEKFFIPESQSKHLDDQLRRKQSEAVLSVTPSGKAHVKYLIIGGVRIQ